MYPFESGRPDVSEFAPYAKAYVDLVDGDNIVEILSTQIETTEVVVRELEDASASMFAYAPGKWTVNEVIGHLSDSERIFSYRALCVARGDAGPLPGFDEAAYASMSSANDRSLQELWSELRLARLSSIAMFRGLSREAWSRRGEVNRYSVTVRGLAFHLAGHELHHVKILRERYVRTR